jgi:hypothetical protein
MSGAGMSGQCPACWVLVGADWLMVALEVTPSGALAVASSHERPRRDARGKILLYTGPVVACVGTGSRLERA